MSQLVNDSILETVGADGYPSGDDLYIGAAASTVQAGAVPIRAQVHRVVRNQTANAALILRQIATGDAPPLVWIVNDSGNDVRVYPFTGGSPAIAESVNAVANAFFTVTAGNSAIFLRVPTQIKRKGGTSGGGTMNWSAALLS